MIYGHSIVLVDKQLAECCWIVKTTTDPPQELVRIPWRYAFDQIELCRSGYSYGFDEQEKRGRQYYDKNLLAALELCLLLVPLDPEDLAALDRRSPGYISKPMWHVDRSVLDWEIEPAPPTPRAPRRRAPAPQEGRYSAPAAECSTPVAEEVLVVPDPERKLLF